MSSFTATTDAACCYRLCIYRLEVEGCCVRHQRIRCEHLIIVDAASTLYNYNGTKDHKMRTDDVEILVVLIIVRHIPRSSYMQPITQSFQFGPGRLLLLRS
jgi:hypothetical protein